jgi:hypothetical protein
MRRTVQLEAQQTVLIDGTQGETFIIRMNRSIWQLWTKNLSPGQLYVFVMTQDSRGGHTVQWGDQVYNVSPLNPAPHSTTVQSFIGNADGTLQANLVAACSQPKGGPSWQPRRSHR